MKSTGCMIKVVQIVSVQFFFSLLVFVSIAGASATIAWQPPDMNEDGTTCSDLAGYKIYYDIDGAGDPYNGIGLSEGDSPITIPLSSLDNPDQPEVVFSALTQNITYTIVVTAYDTSGNESEYSNMVELSISDSEDTDHDGLSDLIETSYGLNPAVSDSDGDGINDLLEFGPFQTAYDSDGDGTIDALDSDSDNDGISDSVESNSDADFDGAPNYRDANDTDGPGADQDGDGLTNLQESTYGLNPNLVDSDGDLIPDLEEWGLNDVPLNTDNDDLVDALDSDADNDGVSDLDEDGADYNQDGLLDRLDNRTATMVTEKGKMAVDIQHLTARLKDVRFVEEVSSDSGKPDLVFPYGGVEYKIVGIYAHETVLVSLIMPNELPASSEYWKYDAIQGYQKLDSQTNGNAITFLITDGGLGDCDQLANGVIFDPGYVGMPESESVTGIQETTNAAISASSGGGCKLSNGVGNSSDGVWLLLPFLMILILKGAKRHQSRRS